MPKAMRIHPVVNVNQVKKYHSSLQRPPPIKIDGEEEYEVENILDHRRSGSGYQYLVSWSVMMPLKTCGLLSKSYSIDRTY